jgi:hypothetical protein
VTEEIVFKKRRKKATGHGSCFHTSKQVFLKANSISNWILNKEGLKKKNTWGW